MADAAPKEKKLTKKELRILEKQRAAAAAAEPKLNDLYGELPLIQSQEKTDRVFKHVGDINPELQGESFWVRGNLQSARAKSKIAFLTIRQQMASIQAVMNESDVVPRDMIKFSSGIPKESIVDVFVTVMLPAQEVTSTTQKNVELSVQKIFIVSKALPQLPFQFEDAARPEALLKAEGSTYVDVLLDTRLNTRVLDLRTPANQAIMRIQSGVSQLFREFLQNRDFVEIHTPKLIGGASESGSSVFKLAYFDQEACLAQSPQLYKQMACACSGLERVYEIGPVFRAENSNTHRHMCEFTGLDFEMVIKEHYHEVLEVFSDLFIYIFDNLTTRFAKELAAVNDQYPFEPLKYHKPSLIISFEEGVNMLKAAGANQEMEEDLSTENEKWLGRLVKEKYDTDFYILDKFPLAVRPFYTMPDPTDKRWSNSYDLMIRGEEIVSGAQRVHDAKLLEERVDAFGIEKETLKAYLDAFKLGALPHGGGGIGLERVVMLYLGLGNIRKASMFPRDPWANFQQKQTTDTIQTISIFSTAPSRTGTKFSVNGHRHNDQRAPWVGVVVTGINDRKLVVWRYFKNAVERGVLLVTHLPSVIASVETNAILQKLERLHVGVTACVIDSNSHVKQTAFQKANHPRRCQLNDLIVPTRRGFLPNHITARAHIRFGLRRHENQLSGLFELFDFRSQRDNHFCFAVLTRPQSRSQLLNFLFLVTQFRTEHGHRLKCNRLELESVAWDPLRCERAELQGKRELESSGREASQIALKAVRFRSR